MYVEDNKSVGKCICNKSHYSHQSRYLVVTPRNYILTLSRHVPDPSLSRYEQKSFRILVFIAIQDY